MVTRHSSRPPWLQSCSRASPVLNTVPAVQLKHRAEQYVGAFANLARTTNTMILPANLADVAGLIATAMTVVKQGEHKKA